MKNLRIEEAALTGESVPSEKTDIPVEAKAQIGDRRSMAYSGTLVVSGRARSIVVGTGADTALGHINAMLSNVKTMETPLLRQIERFGKILTAIIVIVCVLTFAYGRLFLDEPFVDMFKAAVGIAVSAIPEGLPAIVTITLAIGVQRMASRRAIIRRLPAVEVLGSVSRICPDKTGTLTRNEMVVCLAARLSPSLRQFFWAWFCPSRRRRFCGNGSCSAARHFSSSSNLKSPLCACCVKNSAKNFVFLTRKEFGWTMEHLYARPLPVSKSKNKSIMNYYIDAWKNYVNFQGRARRKAYWMFVLFNFIAIFIASIIDNVLGTGGFIASLYSLAIFLPSLALGVRRLHDIGKSGWWLLIAFIPLIGGIVLLVFAIMDSQPGVNQYGPNPKGA